MLKPENLYLPDSSPKILLCSFMLRKVALIILLAISSTPEHLWALFANYILLFFSNCICYLLRPGLSEWVNVSLLIVEGTNDVVADDLQQEKWEDATRNGVRTKKHMLYPPTDLLHQ